MSDFIDRFTIGIDPGVKTGFAVYDRELKKINRLLTLCFVSTIRLIEAEYPDEEVFAVVVEVPKTKKNWHGPKAAHDVGRVCRESELMAAMLIEKGYSVITQHPSGIGKDMTKDAFSKLTGWPKWSNGHTRDAGLLCFGL